MRHTIPSQPARDLLGLNACKVWDTGSAYQHLSKQGMADTRRTAERRLQALGLLPPVLTAENLQDESGRAPLPMVLDWEIKSARARRQLVLFAQLAVLPDGMDCLHLNDGRGARYWLPLASPSAEQQHVLAALHQIQAYLGKTLSIFPHGRLLAHLRDVPDEAGMVMNLLSHAAPLPPLPDPAAPAGICPPHLKRLEARSIYQLREALVHATRPAMLFSGGKDSAVLLHLARKAFFPMPPPLPLLHIASDWEFRGMPELRQQMAQASGMSLLEYVSSEAAGKNINPSDSGADLQIATNRRAGLQQALAHYQLDLLLSTTRRDEGASHPARGFWDLFEGGTQSHQVKHIHPLADWTENDIWHYISLQGLTVSPLYFSSERAVIEREGKILMIDDARIELKPGEQIRRKRIRFSALGSSSLTAALSSSARNPAEILHELTQTHIHPQPLPERHR